MQRFVLFLKHAVVDVQQESDFVAESKINREKADHELSSVLIGRLFVIQFTIFLRLLFRELVPDTLLLLGWGYWGLTRQIKTEIPSTL